MFSRLTFHPLAVAWLLLMIGALGCEPPPAAPVTQSGPPSPPAPPPPPPTSGGTPATAPPAQPPASLPAASTTGSPAPGAGGLTDRDLTGPLKIIETPEIAKLRSLGPSSLPMWQQGTHEIKNEQITQLHFLNGSRFSDAEAPLLLSLPNLQELTCQLNTITDTGLETIGQLKKLKWLHLHGGVQGVTDQGMAHVKNLTELERFGLLGSAITDDGVANLAELTNLKTVDLSSNNLTDDALQHFHGLKKLEQLYLHQTRVTPEGIAELKKVLPMCKIEGN